LARIIYLSIIRQYTVISEFIENQLWNNNFVGVVIEFYVLWDLSAKIKVTI